MTTETFVMPFGKHRGKPLDEVPRGYLHWCLENVPGMYPETREAIEAHVARPATRAAEPMSEAPLKRPRASRRVKKPDVDPQPACARCGLPASPSRPLVHAACAGDEVPF